MVPILVKTKLAENHFLMIEKTLQHHIKRVIDDNGISTGVPRSLTKISARLKAFLNELLDPMSNSLKDLICMHPQDIPSYVNGLHQTKATFINKNHKDYKMLYNIFVASTYNSSIFDKYNFINMIDLSTCPYCNRNYIYSVNKRKEVKPEIDHFYPKSIYPILAISYFNLIPSCEPCNGLGAKKQLDPFALGLISPYLLTSNQFKFTFKIKNISAINPLLGKTDIEVLFKDKIQSHCDVFNLDDLYSLHNDHAIELVIKRRLKYSKKFRDYLNSYGGLKFNKSEIDRMILGNYSLESEQHKKPLSKLYQDIGKELGLI